ncbi:MAG: hypothetical protein CMH12_01135 [Maritimibacter sp.]|nr:hypothetical protein [Maritimibacter sp.]
MIKAVSACLAALLLAAPAVADPCLEEIAALFDDGGAMDPFARPPLHQFTQEYDTDGNPTRLNEALFDGPLKTIAGVAAENHFTMAIDRDLWNGPSLDGPWTGVDYQFPQGREEQMRAALAQNRANLTDTACHGTEDGLLHYTWRTQTDKDATGMFYGGLTDAWVDPDTGLMMRMEMTEFVNSWTEGTDMARHEVRFEYDPSISVTAPE